MWVQPWQSDCIVEQAAEFIRKKLARRSAGLAPIGQSRGPLRLRAPQTFLRIIFSIPLLSSVRTDQITAQGLHCEGRFQKALFSMLSPFYAFPLSHLIHHNSKKEKKKNVFPIMTSFSHKLNDCLFFFFFFFFFPAEKQSPERFVSHSPFLERVFFWKPKQCKTAETGAWPHQCAAWSSTDRCWIRLPGRGLQTFPETSCSVATTCLAPPTAACHCGCSRAVGTLRLEDNQTIWGQLVDL